MKAESRRVLCSPLLLVVCFVSSVWRPPSVRCSVQCSNSRYCTASLGPLPDAPEPRILFAAKPERLGLSPIGR